MILFVLLQPPLATVIDCSIRLQYEMLIYLPIYYLRRQDEGLYMWVLVAARAKGKT